MSEPTDRPTDWSLHAQTDRQCALDCSLIQWCFGRRARARRDDRLNRSTASDRTAPHRTAPHRPRPEAVRTVVRAHVCTSGCWALRVLMSPTQDDPTRGKSASVRPFAKPGLKRPEDDPVIQMARDRHKKGLQIEKQRHAMSGASGAVLHKILELKSLEADLKAISEGVQEYQDQVALPAATYTPTHPLSR